MELDMTRGKPAGLIVRFVVPIIIGNIFQQLYSMVDAIIVGRFVGNQALAAVGATGTIVFLILGFMQGLTAGFGVLTAQRFGAGEKRGVRRSVANGLILSALVTVISTAVSVLSMRTLLTWMNTPGDIFEEAHAYISIICLGMWSNVLYNLLASFLRAVGNSKTPLYFLVLSACCNVVLDLALIVLFNMGVAGAARATVISQGLSGILCLIYIVRRAPALWPERDQWRLHKGDTRSQMRIGIPMALQFSITAVGTIIMQSALNLFGSTAVAAYTAVGKLQQLYNQPFVSMGQAMATYGGQNMGRADWTRIRQGVKCSIAMVCVYGVVGGIIMVMLVPFGVRLFVSENIAQIIDYGNIYIRLCALFYIPLGMIFVYRNILQGCGFGFVPMMGGVVELASRMAMAFVAIRNLSYSQACFCDAAAWGSAGAFLFASYHWIMRKKT